MCNIERMCCKKLSCLFEVVAQKSGRLIARSLLDALPSSPTTVIDDFLPNGGLARTTS